MIITIKHPLMIQDKEVTELTIDFDKLTGNDFIMAEQEVRAMGDTTPTVFLSMKFQAALAARCLGVPVDDILALPGNDFRSLIVPMANFLLN